MGVLVDGEWRDGWYDTKRAGGQFVRKAAGFRNFVTADSGAKFPAAKGRYHLYVAHACPWCHRAMIFRVLKKLEHVISVSAVEPLMLERGWTFADPDPLTGANHVYEIYQRADPKYSGSATVPILWDKQAQTIVNNESSEIIRMFNGAFAAFTDNRADFYPADLAPEIDRVNARIYEGFNNGVYRAGFATTQEAYEKAATEVFETLDWIEALLSKNRYLLGDRLTEADWRLFPTLVRFDGVYFGHFKCNLRHVYEYPAIAAYARRLYAVPGIALTCYFAEYKQHYYGSHRTINPTGIVPLGPGRDFRTADGI